jgi:hypothetical protein
MLPFQVQCNLETSLSALTQQSGAPTDDCDVASGQSQVSNASVYLLEQPGLARTWITELLSLYLFYKMARCSSLGSTSMVSIQ